MILKMTLTQCRSNPKRYVRFVVYRPSPDGRRIDPYLVRQVDGRYEIDRIPWRDVRECDADPEFAAAWADHIRTQLPLTGDVELRS